MNCSHGTNPSSSSSPPSPCWWLTGQLTGTNALAKTLECFLLLILVAMLEIKELGYHKPNTFSPFIFLSSLRCPLVRPLFSHTGSSF